MTSYVDHASDMPYDGERYRFVAILAEVAFCLPMSPWADPDVLDAIAAHLRLMARERVAVEHFQQHMAEAEAEGKRWDALIDARDEWKRRAEVAEAEVVRLTLNLKTTDKAYKQLAAELEKR